MRASPWAFIKRASKQYVLLRNKKQTNGGESMQYLLNKINIAHKKKEEVVFVFYKEMSSAWCGNGGKLEPGPRAALCDMETA